MLEFDSAALKFAQTHGGTYLRYCDDMLFLMPLGMKLPTEAFVTAELKALAVEINTDKTDACDFTLKGGLQTANHPLQYLGFMYDGQRIVIRSAAFAKFSNRMKRGVSLAKQTKRRKNRLRTRLGAPERELYLRKIFTRYSHLGKRNFLRYGYSAADIMNSTEIRRQLRPLWARLLNEISD
jgi:hypothetical protein